MERPMESHERKSPTERAEALAAADEMYIDGVGGCMHTVAHPVKYGILNAAVAAASIPLFGLNAIANTAARIVVAAESRDTKIVDAAAEREKRIGTP
jgi:hypothetical protein